MRSARWVKYDEESRWRELMKMGDEESQFRASESLPAKRRLFTIANWAEFSGLMNLFRHCWSTSLSVNLHRLKGFLMASTLFDRLTGPRLVQSLSEPFCRRPFQGESDCSQSRASMVLLEVRAAFGLSGSVFKFRILLILIFFIFAKPFFANLIY